MQRWHIELHYRQIKTNLGLDVLRGLSPATVERELWMHAIAYNLIRALMLKGALTGQIPVARLSFKGTLDLLMSWAPLATRKRLLRHLKQELIDRIISDLVPFRPGRSEPRAKKRRPKNYQFLTKPRHIFRVSASRALK
ncbi:MAG: transposase [Opitutaceae bacterium]|nr:transposase [Opitutaceae bacterium]